MSVRTHLNRAKYPLLTWIAQLFLWLVPLLCAWWWLGGAELFLRGLRVLANSLFPMLFSQGVIEILRETDQSWKVRTGLAIVASVPPQSSIIFIEHKTLLRMVTGYPLFWALVLASYGPRTKRLIWGTILLSGVSLMAIASYLWAMIPVLVNHEPSSMLNLVPPNYQVSGKSYPSWIAHLSSFAHFLAILIIPFMSPVLMWIAVSPGALKRLVVSLRHKALRVT